MLSIIVITILALSFVMPFVAVNAAIGTPTVDDTAVEVGDVITVSGDAGNVTSGATIEVYWDVVVGASAWLLNTTTGDPDGSYEVEITVPATPSGNHYVWVKDTGTVTTANSEAITVSSTLDVDPEEGLTGDELTLEGTGFDGEAQYNVSFFNWTIASQVVDIDDDEETDEYGSFSVTFDVPSGWVYGDYVINVTDGTNNNITVGFTIGPAITLTPDEGPEGSVVTITGRGFTPDVLLNETDISWDNAAWDNIQIVDDEIQIDEDGEFSGEIIIPSWGVGDYNVTVNDGTWTADLEFAIDGAADVSVDPTYGSPGATITVEGANFTQDADTTVELYLMRVSNGANTSVGDVETESDGTFTGTFTVPAVPFDTYRLIANSSDWVNATDAFKVGIIAVIISPTSGASGDEVTVTGTGFETGDFNCSIGDDLVIDGGTVDAEETLSDTFYVPTMDPGTYSVVIIDEEENEVAVTYVVTDTTSLEADPSDVAVGYNLTLEGDYFAESEDTELTWYVYNSSWSLDISEIVNFTDTADNANLTQYGNFTALYTIPATLLLGNTYTINATDNTAQADTWAETTITIVEEEVEIGPNMLSYSLGDTVTFAIRATFTKVGSVLEIEDPDGELYFMSTYNTWTEVDPWQVVQIRNQVDDASGYPYIIPSDASTGTWTWTLYEDATDDSDVIATGTIEVLPTTAAQVDARLSDVEDSIADLATDLADDIAGVQSDIADDIDALSSEVGDVASEVDTLRDDIVGDLADDIAGATAAANAAGDAVDDLEGSLSDLEDSVGDIADVADTAAAAADAAADAASDAATAAGEASDAASGLTTLVYGAIGASLIAALAAIVSLMQISRRIAG